MFAGCGDELASQYRLECAWRSAVSHGQRVVVDAESGRLADRTVRRKASRFGKQELLQKVWPGTVV